MFFIDTLYLSSGSSVLRDGLKGENDRKLLNVPRKIKRKPKTIFKKFQRHRTHGMMLGTRVVPKNQA